MVPNKVIHISEARRNRDRARSVAPTRLGIAQRITGWLTSTATATKVTILLAGVVAGLVMGAVVAYVVSVPASQPLEEISQVSDTLP